MTALKCGSGRRLNTSGPHPDSDPCPNRPEGDSIFCALHKAERLAALETLAPEKRGKSQRWGGGSWMVSGRGSA